MFELGARWGAGLHLAPLLGAGAGTESLRGPLNSLNALNCEDIAQVHQLVGDLAELLGVRDATSPAAYQDLISSLVAVSKSNHPKSSTLAVHPTELEEKIEVTSQGTSLDTLETEVLRFFSGTPGKSSEAGPIAEHLSPIDPGQHPLRIDQLLERLVKRGLLGRGVRIGLPSVYRLSSKGRDYVIENYIL